jgi:hypothetical protein
MKGLNILVCIVLGYCGATVCWASPPAQVNDSFFRTTLVGPFGISDDALYYLAQDGTCELLVQKLTFDNNLTYSPSQSGTYTYVPTPGSPNEATLTVNLAAMSTANVLTFTGDTYGTMTANAGFASFSIYLASPNTFLKNVSNRVTLRSADTAVTGFVIDGAASKLVLIRTVGPTLAEFGISPVSGNPMLNLFSGIGTDQIASGQPWSSATGYDPQAMSWIFGIAGAFQLEPGSNDVVFFGLLSPGSYTAQATDSTTGTKGGSALTEVYILPYSGSSSDDFAGPNLF